MEKETIFNLVSEELENEVYDIMDVVTEKQMQECVYRIINHYSTGKGLNCDLTLNGMKVRVSNRQHGFISVSDDDATGVSRSLWYIVEPNHDYAEQITNIISMLNEAWYLAMEG